MKTLKGLILAILFCGFVMACGGDGDSQSEQSSNDLTDREQAELVAATLTAKEGGLGKDFENIAQAAAEEDQEDRSIVQGDLDVSAQMEFYDAQGAVQAHFDFDTTDSIQYNSQIKGNLSLKGCYFQEFVLNNQSNFTVDEILSGVAFIDGTHHLHASYARESSLTGAEVNFNLDCDLTVTGVTVDMHKIDIIPDMGTIQGSIAGSYVRNGVHADINHQVDFGFSVTYMGNNKAEIDLDGGAVFSVNLDTGNVIEIVID